MTDGNQGHVFAREGFDVTSDHLEELSEHIYQHKGEGSSHDTHDILDPRETSAKWNHEGEQMENDEKYGGPLQPSLQLLPQSGKEKEGGTSQDQDQESIHALNKCLEMWNTEEKSLSIPVRGDPSPPNYKVRKIQEAVQNCTQDQESLKVNVMTPMLSSHHEQHTGSQPLKPVIAPLVRCSQPMLWSTRMQLKNKRR